MLILRNEICDENYPLKARTLLLTNSLDRSEVYMLREKDIKKDSLNGGYYAYIHDGKNSVSHSVVPFNLRHRRITSEIDKDTIWVFGAKRFTKRAFAKPTPVLGIRTIQGLRRTYIVNTAKSVFIAK